MKMEKTMFAVGVKKPKVLYPIVATNPVDVMNDFFWLKISAKPRFHDETMFVNISTPDDVRVVWAKDEYISLFHQPSPPAPIVMLIAAHGGTYLCFMFRGDVPRRFAELIVAGPIWVSLAILKARRPHSLRVAQLVCLIITFLLITISCLIGPNLVCVGNPIESLIFVSFFAGHLLGLSQKCGDSVSCAPMRPGNLAVDKHRGPALRPADFRAHFLDAQVKRGALFDEPPDHLRVRLLAQCV
jgi:hypothetical protein